MEEEQHEAVILHESAGLTLAPIPNETVILSFRLLLEKYDLASGILPAINGYLGDRGLTLSHVTIFAATIIHAPSSIPNQDGKRAPKMH